ncbi:flagellar hook-associated protein FlgL [Bacillus sp. FJAT-45350]|uniref:flagellar hook-associated protein FlgL n=1 Tax=Bacillus sp. FJAT-45350 TaxID=2011014 RepID=UPI000BB6B035|nr:flagellar hook-associated protein FlgL [Bacillus sp. FJAT-45350]
MRVTQTMLANNTLRHISQGYENLGRIQDQLASGKKITRAHQDPVIAMKGMRYRTEVTEVEQFKRNLSEVNTWMDNADSALDKVNQAIHRIRELVVQASNDTYEPTQRANIAKEIRQINDHIASLANTKANDKYIFNGTNTTNPPVNLDGVTIKLENYNFDDRSDYALSYQGKEFRYVGENVYQSGNKTITVSDEPLTFTYNDPDGETGDFKEENIIISNRKAVSTNNHDVKIEVMKGIEMAVNIRPQNVFSAHMFANLDAIANTLEDPTKQSEDITKFLDVLSGFTDDVVSERAELGARVNRVDMIQNRVWEQEVVSRRILSDNEDADMEKVIIDLTTQESVHRAALAVGARIIQPTLMDFLR